MPFRLRGCPRCGGDLELRRDPQVGWEWHCVQCGHSADAWRDIRRRVAARGPYQPRRHTQ